MTRHDPGPGYKFTISPFNKFIRVPDGNARGPAYDSKETPMAVRLSRDQEQEICEGISKMLPEEILELLQDAHRSGEQGEAFDVFAGRLGGQGRTGRDRRLNRDEPPEFSGRPRPGGEQDPVEDRERRLRQADDARRQRERRFGFDSAPRYAAPPTDADRIAQARTHGRLLDNMKRIGTL